MRKLRSKQAISIDLDHMQTLHAEAIEQLDLLKTALEAAEQAKDTMRDNLDTMAANHWQAYMDVLHMICMHDEAMNNALKKFGVKMRDDNFDKREQQPGISRLLLLFLLTALIRRHRRMVYVYSLRGEPMNDYLKESLTMEREHMADLITMIHSSM
ncbi:hypothetical protein HSX37_15385|uniref:Uncharacterized protein n=1 Tax=Dendrosporobacter quercicolus TaxID=146817 RepID=A0A1G9RLB2_9FIRM|nr:hypothetical protein [Dendrosporobacter quercicolus]NSL49416.1 hypothetical protein [Dendrosporobacter quercicolus DSM 1736]SDM23951.1 hypothetical protein SAMN04488502_10328 [Dendrosporobacter quercicolus]